MKFQNQCAATRHIKSGRPESNQGPSDCCRFLQSDALPTELQPGLFVRIHLPNKNAIQMLIKCDSLCGACMVYKKLRQFALFRLAVSLVECHKSTTRTLLALYMAACFATAAYCGQLVPSPPQEMGQAPYVFIFNTSSRILFAWQTSGQQHNSRSTLIPEISASNRLFRKRARWHAGWFTRIATIIANSILPAAALHLPDGRQRCGGFEFRNTCNAIGG